MRSSKYTLVEFLTALESEDFDEIDENWIGWSKDFLSKLNSNLSDSHNEDCDKTKSSCYLCTIENLLKNYREYYHNEEQWRKNNL
jgi:hypothetical protein